MQRKGLRIVVAGVDTDVQLATFANGQVATYDSAAQTMKGTTPGGSGDFVGPASSVDNHLVLFSGTTGKLGKDSAAIVVDASSNVTGAANVTATRFTGPATGLRESTPTDLTMAAVADAEKLTRVGTTVIGKQELNGWNTATQVSAVTALADVTGHTFSLKSGFTYYFRFKGAYRSNATTTGLKMSAQYSGTSSSYNMSMWVNTSATGAASAFFAQTALNTAMGSGTGPGAVDASVELWGRIVTTSAGTFAFRIASEIAVASGITLAIGALSEVWQA